MSNHIKIAEAWKKIQEDEMNPPMPQEQMINIFLTKKEIALIKSLVQAAVSEMTSDPNSGMKGVSPEITAVIQKLDATGQQI